MLAVLYTFAEGLEEYSLARIVFTVEAEQSRKGALVKTGTLTRNRPTVIETAPAPGHTAEQVLAVAAALEERSEQPPRGRDPGRIAGRHFRRDPCLSDSNET